MAQNLLPVLNLGTRGVRAWLPLVVDDERTIVDLVKAVLEDEGFAVATARDGLEALALLPSVQPALVLSDVMMPRLDGITLCSKLVADSL